MRSLMRKLNKDIITIISAVGSKSASPDNTPISRFFSVIWVNIAPLLFKSKGEFYYSFLS
jgi:hypothetical protein